MHSSAWPAPRVRRKLPNQHHGGKHLYNHFLTTRFGVSYTRVHKSYAGKPPTVCSNCWVTYFNNWSCSVFIFINTCTITPTLTNIFDNAKTYIELNLPCRRWRMLIFLHLFRYCVRYIISYQSDVNCRFVRKFCAEVCDFCLLMTVCLCSYNYLLESVCAISITLIWQTHWSLLSLICISTIWTFLTHTWQWQLHTFTL